MDVQIIEKIITMLGDATGQAATVAILWVVGSFLASIISSGLFFYGVYFIAKSGFGYLNSKEENKRYLDDANFQIKNFAEKMSIKEKKHNSELEKVKHLYKILKESQNVEED